MKRSARRSGKKAAAQKPSSSAIAPKHDTAHEPELFWTVAISVIALILRLSYLVQIDSIPLFYHLAGDGRSYDEWAQRIAGGDWLGTGVFYQAPLYPYFLGVLQIIFGHNLWLIRFIQIILGSLSCTLIYLVGRKLFSPRAGIAGGLFLACYGPAIFFDGLIEKSVLDVLLLALLLFVLSRDDDPGTWTKWLSAGALLGLLGLSRENALVLAPMVLVWTAFHFAHFPLTLRARWLGLFLAGLLLILLPVGLRNLFVGGEFKLTTSQLGANFFIGNNAAADGTYGSVRNVIREPQLEGPDAKRLAERSVGRALTPGEVSSYWLHRSLEYIKSHPADWLRLLGSKWLLVWNFREIEDSDDFYIYQRWSWLLALFGRIDHFGILAPLAALGVAVTWRQWRSLWLLYAMILSLAVSVAGFYVFGRYRFPLVPLLTLFAGAGVAETLEIYKKLQWRSWLLPLGAALAVAVIVNWPIRGGSEPGAAGYNNLSNAYNKEGKVAAAIDAAQRAIMLEPGYGVAHYNLGNLYVQQRKLDVARSHFEEALRLYPNYADVHSNYGQLLAEQGDLDAGINHFRQAIALNPGLPRAHLNLGVALAKQGRLAEAIAPLRQAAQMTPDSADASYYLGSVLAAQNRYDEAAQLFYRALRVQPDFAPAHQSLAQVLLLQGKKDQAMQHYQEALRLMKQRPTGTAGR
jgi:tetratricopeptide (TPR) repeat protein